MPSMLPNMATTFKISSCFWGESISSITRLQELELLKRKGGKKNGEWIVAIDI